MRILELTLITIFVACSLYAAYITGCKANKPTSDYFWIDNNRFAKDSLIHCSPIYEAPNVQIGEVIRVSYGENTIYIECVDEKGYTWEEWRDSFLNAFKVGCDE